MYLLPPSVCVFVVAVAGVATRMSASLEESAAEKTKAREALIGSAGMEQLIKMVAQDDGEVRRNRKHEIQTRTQQQPRSWMFVPVGNNSRAVGALVIARMNPLVQCEMSHLERPASCGLDFFSAVASCPGMRWEEGQCVPPASMNCHSTSSVCWAVKEGAAWTGR